MNNKKHLYIDLLVSNEDLTLDEFCSVVLCDNQISIAQDIKHMLLESGLVTALIAERSQILRQDIFLKMILLLEEDKRLVPGTIIINEQGKNRLLLSADTVEFGKIESMEILL